MGEYIYRVISGNNQKGAAGQYLKEPIKIVVTDLQGQIIRKNLELELSDESGELSNYSSYYEDTLNIKWKLGCLDTEQKILIKDPNVCGIAKSGCIEVNIFNVTASASEEISEGWYSPCRVDDVYYYNYFLFNDNRIAIEVNKQLISTSDPISSTWEYATLPFQYENGRYNMLSSGEIFYADYSDVAISSKDGKSWKIINIPFYSGNYTDIDITNNGTYFIVGDNYSSIYSSKDASNWTEYLDIWDITGGSSNNPQAITIEGNKVYVLVNNKRVIEIDASNGDTAIHEFNSGYWSSNTSLPNFYFEASGSELFLMSKYSTNSVIVLNLNNDIATTFTVSGSSNRLVKSGGEISVLSNSSIVKTWNGANFDSKSYPLPGEESYYRYFSYGLFNGSLIAVDGSGKLYYYIEN